jgi:Protein of unknown function (DUF4031)
VRLHLPHPARAVAAAAGHAPAADPMTVYVDECRWWWRGRLWCHMISDTSLAELHAVAKAAGVPRWAFQGDHYDLHPGVREMARRAGAQPIETRELVARLKASGLRITPAMRRASHSTPS